MYLSLYCKGSRKLFKVLLWEGARDRTELQYIDPPTLMAISVVSFSFSRAAQPEAQGPSSLLDDGFLYCILSPTGLQNSIGSPEVPFGRVWLSLPHLISNSVWSLTVRFFVLTELYISSTPTQSPTQSLEWHVWLSSSGNNCHAVHSHSLPVHQSMSVSWAFYLVPFHQPDPPTRSLSITGHWNVSLPSGVSPWNGMFARAEGQNTTQVLYCDILVGEFELLSCYYVVFWINTLEKYTNLPAIG